MLWRESARGVKGLNGARYVARSIQNERDENEDSFLVLSLMPEVGGSPLYLLVVADGMGGHEHGEEVSRESVSRFGLALTEQLVIAPSVNPPCWRPPPSENALRGALMSALVTTNDRIRQIVQQNRWVKAGSTIVAALLRGDEVAAVNLGDSPLFHYHARQRRTEQVTDDHTVAGVLLRAGLINAEMARVHEGKSRLEFFLGAESLPREEPFYQRALAPGDLLLLCSDGISGALAPEQIGAILAAAGGDLETAAERLIHVAGEAGETDNQTVVLWRHPGRGTAR